MKDPFTHVHQSLQSLFRLEIMRHGKYTYSEVQQLKETTDNYRVNPSKNNFIALKKAVSGSLAYIEKWQLDFDPIKESFDKEAQVHGMPPINWPKMLSHSKASPRFQSSALNHSEHEEDLLLWLAAKSDEPEGSQLSHSQLTQLLVKNQHEHGVRKMLGKHLHKDPHFLFDLIMKSEKNFSKIASTLLSLYLTDEQLATAIIQHTPSLNEEDISYEELNLLIDKLNNNLSYGRSVSTLLRNAHAKDILSSSVLFQIYQSEDYANRTTHVSEHMSYREERVSKPIF